MSNLTCNEMYILVGDLLAPVERASDPVRQAIRLSLLTETLSGRLYGPRLREQYEALGLAIQEEPETEAELRRGLERADTEQALSARALKNLLTGLQQLPLPAERLTAATQVEQALVPSLRFLNESYAREAALLPLHEQAVERLSGALELLGPDVRLAVDGLLKSERRLNQLLLSKTHAVRSNLIRMQLMSTVLRLREALVDEVAINPALPRDADTVLFSAWDDLTQNAARNAAARTPTTPTAP